MRIARLAFVLIVTISGATKAEEVPGVDVYDLEDISSASDTEMAY